MTSYQDHIVIGKDAGHMTRDYPWIRHQIGDVVHFLVSDQSAFVTGETINVSGGWYMRP